MSIKKIAQQAGVSPATVSRVLEGKLMIQNSCTEVEASTWSDYHI